MKNIKTWRERADERGIGSCEARDEEITELRAKLAAMEGQEPVVEVTSVFYGKGSPVAITGTLLTDKTEIWELPVRGGEKLYLAAGAAKTRPLTREQVNAAVNAAGYEEPQERADFINGMRHCEVAHGITGAATSCPVDFHTESAQHENATSTP